MEAPASLVMLVMFLLVPGQPVVYLLLVIWQVHYLHRAFIYPFSIRTGRHLPVVVVLMAILFNTINAFLNGWHFVINAGMYDTNWLLQVNFIVGAVLFVAGFWVTKRSDAVLRDLRAPGDSGYRIPHGFAYRWVSCPNYLGESIQWLGWALMTLSPAAWVFLLWTLANLVPRALSHHRWYRQEFADYPTGRRAIFPHVL